MAKESMKDREVKRAKMFAKYALSNICTLIYLSKACLSKIWKAQFSGTHWGQSYSQSSHNSATIAKIMATLKRKGANNATASFQPYIDLVLSDNEEIINNKPDTCIHPQGQEGKGLCAKWICVDARRPEKGEQLDQVHLCLSYPYAWQLRDVWEEQSVGIIL